jgi:hypothetical protein
MDDILKYLWPVLAGLLASCVTYLLTIRSKKYDILLKERIPAFKSIQQRIVSLKRYCDAQLAEHQGNEFAPRFDDLPDDSRTNALGHRTLLGNVVQQNLIFLSPGSRKSLQELDAQLSLLCNLELVLAGDPDERIASSAPSAYEATLKRIEECVNSLYSELKLPK